MTKTTTVVHKKMRHALSTRNPYARKRQLALVRFIYFASLFLRPNYKTGSQLWVRWSQRASKDNPLSNTSIHQTSAASTQKLPPATPRAHHARLTLTTTINAAIHNKTFKLTSRLSANPAPILPQKPQGTTTTPPKKCSRPQLLCPLLVLHYFFISPNPSLRPR